MVRKKTEGDEDQRRAAANEARRAGEAPSEESATTGASKQRRHVAHGGSLTHEEKLEHLHEGKQGSRTRRGAGQETRQRAPGDEQAERTFRGRGHPDYTDEHQQVFQALADAQRAHGGEAVHLHEVARATGLPVERTRTLLHDLTVVHGLVTELQGADSPDLGPRYETKPSS